jgi:hypothetical protein
MARLVEVVVSPQGEITLRTKGYAGSACLQASKFLEQTLGSKTTERKTSEYYQVASSEQQQQENQA